jgi:hypothetical protein
VLRSTRPCEAATEFNGRMHRTLEARTSSDLADVMRDLPGSHVAAAEPGRSEPGISFWAFLAKHRVAAALSLATISGLSAWWLACAGPDASRRRGGLR